MQRPLRHQRCDAQHIILCQRRQAVGQRRLGVKAGMLQAVDPPLGPDQPRQMAIAPGQAAGRVDQEQRRRLGIAIGQQDQRPQPVIGRGIGLQMRGQCRQDRMFENRAQPRVAPGAVLDRLRQPHRRQRIAAKGKEIRLGTGGRGQVQDLGE
jgi:hypothetical protein